MRPVVFLAAAGLGLVPVAHASEPVDFAKQIAPLLKQHCVSCHAGPKPKSGLRLDSQAGLMEGGNSGKVLTLGDGAASRLVKVIADTDDDGIVMPPDGEGDRFTEEQVALFKDWIDQGAKWPEGFKIEVAIKSDPKDHWSFQPIRRLVPPDVKQADWVRNPIDRFILARLEQDGIAPSAEADRRTLIRRVTLDLIGLVPSPAEVEEFVNDPSPDAYENLLDRLLASPHYGEKWARPWLDLCHYADSDGYLTDQLRPVAWRYRQWVVDALNADLPYDQFTIQQIAGDLLPNATLQERLGTGFLRNTLSNREGGADIEEYRVEQIVDRVQMVSATWLGLTVGCARCHDHKYDPISQREFYQFYTFFNVADEINLDAPLPGEWEAYAAKLPEYEKKRQELLAPQEKDLAEFQAVWEKKVLHAKDHPGEDHIWDRQWELLGLVWGGHLGEGQLEGCQIVQLEPAKRTKIQQQRLQDYFLRSSASITDAKKAADLKIGELVGKLNELEKELPKLTRAPAMQTSLVPRPNYIHVRGAFRERGIDVFSGTPDFLPSLTGSSAGANCAPAERTAPALPPPGEYSAGLGPEPEPNRLTLARSFVSSEHPLTSRVAANRQWQELFGRGIVRTSDDFGRQGERPSHPELLDWLASELQRLGWSMKRFHRLIVTSATYRQSSKARPELHAHDPANTLLAHQSAVRLSAEQIRDVTLVASGLFSPQIDGPCVFPPQPDSVSMEGFDNKWTPSTGADRFRRGLYTWNQRLSPFAMNITFDSPSGRVCSRRERSNTPLQALTMLNDPVFFETAQALALRILREAGPEPAARIDYGYRLCLGRSPEPGELKRLLDYVDENRQALTQEPARVGELVPQPVSGVDATETAVWTGFGSVLLNLHEFITRE